MVRMPGLDLQENLHVIDDAETGLRGVIAIHSSVLGSAAGGCRFWRYAAHEDLVTDAMRLARGMSYKNALAGLPFGGGKAVLQVPEGEFDRAAVFRAFGDAVEAMGGRYITAEDVGTTVADMRAVRDRTRYVAGLDSREGAAGGDPSPWTALGVFESLKAAAEGMLGLTLRDATVAVQGVGNVGAGLCRLLAREGARLVVADVNEDRAAALAAELGARQVSVDQILEQDVDVLAPCALGAVLNDATIPTLRARLVCGGANNQLADEHHGEALRQRGIIYAPDYVVNAGGIINVSAEYLGETVSQVEARVSLIAPRLLDILREAETKGVASNVVADTLARNTIAASREEVA